MNKLPFFKKIMNKLSLRSIIIFPIFTILILGSIFSYLQVNHFANKYSEQIIVTNQLNIKNHIYDHLNSYFEVPEIVNVSNAILAENGQLDLEDPIVLGSVFLDQVNKIPSVSFAYYANLEGGIVSSGIHDGMNRISYTNDMQKGDFQVHGVDEFGQIIDKIKVVKDFDPRTKTWFMNADAESIYWTKVYSGVQEDVLGISTSYPHISLEGEKIGVFGADIMLDQLSDFMMTMETTENAVVCLIDEDGFIVASSVDEKPFIKKGNSQTRRSVKDSQSMVISQGFDSKIKEGLLSSDEVRTSADIEGRKYYYSITKYSRSESLNWHLLIAIPREDFVNDLELIYYRFVVLFLGMIILLFIIYIFISKWILHPVTSLNTQVKAIIDENWGTQIKTERFDELGQLTESFNLMSIKLSEYLNMLMNKQNELEEINSSLEEIVQNRTKELQILSVTDDLTKIYNKRYLIETLSSHIEMYKKHGMTFTIVILDIDHFKKVNDTYGHIEGDKTLSDVSKFLSSKIRSSDILGRYGGEEFMIIMRNTLLHDAYAAAERFRDELSRTPVGSKNNFITISGGVAEYEEDESIIEIIKRADKKLYVAKENGRNKIVK